MSSGAGDGKDRRDEEVVCLRGFDPAEHSGEAAGWIDPKQRTGAGRSEEGAEFVVCANLYRLDNG